MVQVAENFAPLAPIRLYKSNGQVRGFGFGASTDSARGAALVAATNAAVAGDLIEFEGACALPSALTIDVQITIRGTGYGSHISRAGDVANVTADRCTFENLRSTGRWIVTGAEEVKFVSCWMDGSSQAQAVRIESLSHFATFTNCFIRGGATHCVYVIQSNGTKFTGCVVTEGTQDGLYFDFDASAPTGTQGCGAAGSINSGHGAYYDPDAALKWNPPTITGCTIKAHGRYGVVMRRCHDPVIVGNNFERCLDGAIYCILPIETVIVGNEFERNSWGSIDTPQQSSSRAEIIVQLDPMADGVAYGQIQIQSNHFGNVMHAVHVNGNSTTAAYTVLIQNNEFSGLVGNATIPSRAVWVKEYDDLYTIVASGNVITGSGTIANIRGIEIDTAGAVVDASRVEFSNNNIRSVDRGIQLNLVDNAKVKSNTIQFCTYGIRNTSATNTVVYDNILQVNVTNDFLSDGTSPSYTARGNLGLADSVAARWTESFSHVVATSVTDATTYYFSNTNSGLTSTSLNRRVFVPFACRITKAYIVSGQTGGSNETSTVAIRVNDTTDTTVSSSVTNDATATGPFNNTSLNIPLSAGDYFNFKWTTPTWATNPTNVALAVRLEFEAA
jgi:hypothetical protein